MGIKGAQESGAFPQTLISPPPTHSFISSHQAQLSSLEVHRWGPDLVQGCADSYESFRCRWGCGVGTSLFSYQLPGGCDSEAVFLGKGLRGAALEWPAQDWKGSPPHLRWCQVWAGGLILSPLYPPFLHHALPRDLGNSPGQTPLGIVHWNVCGICMVSV